MSEERSIPNEYWHVSDVEKLQAENAALRREVEAAKREADRIRHGHAIEGDFICPNGLEVLALRAEVERLRHFVALVQSDVEVERAWQDWERGGKGGQHAGSRPWNAWGYMVLLNFEKYLRHLKEADDA